MAKFYLYDLVSQPEPPVRGGQPVRVDVVYEDVRLAVFGVGLVAEGQAQPLVGATAEEVDFLMGEEGEKLR